MTVDISLRRQYDSLENVMREKFCHDFPHKAPTEFQFWYVRDRGHADGSGRLNRYTYDERRWMAEKNTWERFWPGEDFPGIKPPTGAEMAELNAQEYRSPIYRAQERRTVNGGYPRGGRGGRAHSMLPSSSRAFGVRGRGGYQGRSRVVHPRRLRFGSFDQTQRSSLAHDGEPISLHDDTTSLSKEISSLDTTDTHLLIALDRSPSTIVCRQCGVTGHPEMHCPYEVVVKQGFDRERHLVCGTLGHRAFRFNSYHGCPECKQDREDKEAKCHGMVDRENNKMEKPDPTVTPVQGEIQATRALGNEATACGNTDSNGSEKVHGCGTGWEEPKYNEAVRKNTLRSSDKFIETIALGIKNQSIIDLAGAELKKNDDEGDGEDGQCLIKF